jgi:hypothetical protein
VIRVPCDPKFSAKDGDPRTTLFPGELQEILKPYRAILGLVLREASGKQHRTRRVCDLVERAAKASGVDFTLHDLRRTFAGTLADRGVRTKRIRDYHGHSSLATTEGYYVGRNSDVEPSDGQALSFGLAPGGASGVPNVRCDESGCISGCKPFRTGRPRGSGPRRKLKWRERMGIEPTYRVVRAAQRI